MTHYVTLTFHDCARTYGLSEAMLHELADLGWLRLQPEAAPEPLIEDEADHLARLARLHHELQLPPEGIDLILTMRRRLVQLQYELTRQSARAAQLEAWVRRHPATDVE
ncbi:chaperone modulator CbpM [Hymenobacter sp. 15J16-1T3B]|uniref:chaperone modulator CbpM n=1 Tax=Hymenobacter sp. 15J16-1T3B TaxID=2886941 RepID=UPI001D1263B5|nr:chaperone modulator CbpM [Hymenobacter sp. 15J16-1T3B]MCC3160737.1 chaperone modulator CbpM [Hymenobacter sp. 15J16-1T3B]